MPDKKKKSGKKYTLKELKELGLNIKDYKRVHGPNVGFGPKTHFQHKDSIPKVESKAILLPNFPSKKGEEKPKGKYINLKKGGMIKKETMKKKYGHGGKLKTASLLNNVKTSYAMGGVMKMYGKGGTIPNTMKGFSMLPESVQMQMNPEKAKKYGMGGKMEYKYGGMTKPGKGLPTQHD